MTIDLNTVGFSNVRKLFKTLNKIQTPFVLHSGFISYQTLYIYFAQHAYYSINSASHQNNDLSIEMQQLLVSLNLKHSEVYQICKKLKNVVKKLSNKEIDFLESLYFYKCNNKIYTRINTKDWATNTLLSDLENNHLCSNWTELKFKGLYE